MVSTIIYFSVIAVLASVYRCYFDKLSQIPGPRLVALHPFWSISRLWKGNLIRDIKELHENYGSVVRTGPSELSFSTISAFNTLYGPLSDRNATKAGAVQGLTVALVMGFNGSMASESDKKIHKESRTDVHPIFSEMVRGTVESAHGNMFNKHLINPAVLDDKKNSFNFTTFVQEFAWQLSEEAILGYRLPPSAKAQFERLKAFLPLGSVIIESGCYVLGRNSFQTFSRAIARILKVSGIDFMPFIQTTAFVGPSKEDNLDPENRASSFKGNLTPAKIAELNQKPAQLDENLVVFMAASYDTTKITVLALFYYLLCDREAFMAVREELKGAFQTLSEISDQRLIPLSYLNACINETLRLSPPVNGKVMQRVSLGTTIDGVYVPKGIAVSADTLTMQRSPLYWDQPDSFRPERWINKAPTDDFRAFRPFGYGSRICPGRMMALQSVRLTLAKIVWLYDLEMVSDPIEWKRNAKDGYLWEFPDLYVNVSSSGLK